MLRGSSPLARGTLAVVLRGTVNLGLIPARAGNTNVYTLQIDTMRAHPRSRGEHTERNTESC